ncbi:putative glutamate carboxypeptidase 2 [Platanthera guangdongensis]|uniref:Glutamate carboxypeptidase 2 n=1 Tax=Platanthera guangdongensis TaxID=2320717 RepID=A0ABR2M2T7_9ASPA
MLNHRTHFSFQNPGQRWRCGAYYKARVDRLGSSSSWTGGGLAARRDERATYNELSGWTRFFDLSRYVLVGNHYDAWTFGAVDPNSGTAAFLEKDKQRPEGWNSMFQFDLEVQAARGTRRVEWWGFREVTTRNRAVPPKSMPKRRVRAGQEKCPPRPLGRIHEATLCEITCQMYRPGSPEECPHQILSRTGECPRTSGIQGRTHMQAYPSTCPN